MLWPTQPYCEFGMCGELTQVSNQASTSHSFPLLQQAGGENQKSKTNKKISLISEKKKKNMCVGGKKSCKGNNLPLPMSRLIPSQSLSNSHLRKAIPQILLPSMTSYGLSWMCPLPPFCPPQPTGCAGSEI